MKKTITGILLITMLTSCSAASDLSDEMNGTGMMTNGAETTLYPTITEYYDAVLDIYEFCTSFNDFYYGYDKSLSVDDYIVHNGIKYYRVTTDGFETESIFDEKMHTYFMDTVIDRLYSEELTARCFHKKEDGNLYAYWGSIGTRAYTEPKITEIIYDDVTERYRLSVEYRNHVNTDFYGQTITHRYYFSVDNDGLLKMSDIVYGYDIIDEYSEN